MRALIPPSPLFPCLRPCLHQRTVLLHRWVHEMADLLAIEEQTLPFYHRKRYYPVKPGETLKNLYRIIAKLGYGAYYTVWLAWDEKFVVHAICIQTEDTEPSPILDEINMLHRLKKFAEKDHPGLDFTRLARDIFEIDGPSGSHYCIDFKPQGNSVRTLQKKFPNAQLHKLLVKSIIRRLFFAVNWLHATCGVAHTDISPENVLMDIEDDTVLKHVEQQETENPSTPITTGTGAAATTVYKTRPTMLELSGYPCLTDFGQMRVIEGRINQDWWMTDLYRAPEVLLQLPWGYPVDIWAIGVMGKNLFDPVDRVHGQYVLPLALAQYIGYLRPPPLEIIQKSNLISEPPIPNISLEEFVTTIPPGEEKDQFLRFIRILLTWDPEKRVTSIDGVPDEWLTRPVEGFM
ncbi:kinase-like protein [Aspergillus homomorphus CBS 101889]|uniref:non-specific serine/threonine protein kinase n=1 Tax=Aspergillus homomorphus (strain CBS 101889) TaxID=1450537 RepID=A0A395HQS6_ASPHC|nr:kinase-like protein [Aspergillus homomorphus CBS 101889]RAL10301.1 kinase-like protein [Aspergillus homomorphus CBS 101889]